MDYYSKYPFIHKLREFSSKEVIAFIKQIFAEQGIPERLINDNGSHFSSQHFREFAKAWDFEHITSSPRYPQSNSMAEQCVQTIKAAMKKAILSNWDINMSLLCLRSILIDHVIPSPGKLLFNRKLVSNLPTKCTNQNFRKEEIQNRLLQRQLLQKRQHDEHAKDLPNLSAGQRVRVQDQDTRRWTLAVVRQSCAELCSYIVETPSGQVLHRNRRHLKEDAYTSNTTQAFLHNTPQHHTQLKPSNIPNILPAETTDTHTSICTPLAETHGPVHRTQSSNNKPSGTITRSGCIVNPLPPKKVRTIGRVHTWNPSGKLCLNNHSFDERGMSIWILILSCCFVCTSYMPLWDNKMAVPTLHTSRYLFSVSTNK